MNRHESDSSHVLSPVDSRSRGPTRGDAVGRSICRLLAVSALIEEAELTPKPALVDRRGNGAHHDLDLARLRRSALALQDGFAAIARAAAGESRRCGCANRSDGSVATWSGACWRRPTAATPTAARSGHSGCWSPLPPSAVRTETPASIAAAAAALARLPDRFAPRPLSNGERARLRFGAAGARGEAQAAFPHAIRVGLPTLRAARDRGVPEDCARLDALMAIMASLDDTCLLHRGGLAALEAAKAGARAVLAAGGTAAPAGLRAPASAA